MRRGIFITGTDTGVGKTLVAAGTVRRLRNQGIDAMPMKPVQTGGTLVDGSWSAPDLSFSLAASGIRPSAAEIALMSPYVYEPACSPHLAGRMAGHYPDLARIKDCAGDLLSRHEVLVVEGAGGALVPLNESETMLDMIRALGFPAVIVARPGLGTINHTLLSIRALREAGVQIVGVVINHTGPGKAEDRFIEDDNREAIRQFGLVDILGDVRYAAGFGPLDEDCWRSFDAGMTGWERIAAAVGAGGNA